VALGVAVAAPASADVLEDAPEVPRGTSMSARVTRNLTLMGDEVGLHLSALTGDLVRVKFDFASREGRFRIGGGGETFLLRLDGDVEVHGTTARIRSTIDLGVGGERLTVALPDVDFATQTMFGDRAYELRIPLLEGTF
jgi:hypothetical protein